VVQAVLAQVVGKETPVATAVHLYLAVFQLLAAVVVVVKVQGLEVLVDPAVAHVGATHLWEQELLAKEIMAVMEPQLVVHQMNAVEAAVVLALLEQMQLSIAH
jgi:hypothetical protein